MKVDFKLTGMEGVLDMLKKLPPEVVSKNGGPVRKALRAGATVIAKQARLEVARVVAEANVDGKPSASTGMLQKSITVARGSKGSFAKSGRGERMIVTVRKVAAKRDKGTGKLKFYWRFLEHGTKNMREHKWLRPAFEKKREEAVAKIQSTLLTAIDVAVKNLGRNKR